MDIRESRKAVSTIPADLSLQTPTTQGRTLAQKFLHGLCAHFRAF